MPPQRLDRLPPPRYPGVARAYNNSLRSIVITLCVVVGIWTCIWAIDLFDQMKTDKDHGQPKLALFALVIGILYISTTGITVFGIIAAALQKEKLAKIFAWATIAGSLCVCGAGLLRVIIHYMYKSQLIEECTKVVTGTGITFRFGIWGPRIHDTLDEQQAAQLCRDGWNHDSVSEIVSLLLEISGAVAFAFVSFGFAKQLHQNKKDRKHAFATTNHGFSDSEAAAGYPSHYNPPYVGYDSGPPPPFPGPSPGMPQAPPYSKLNDPFDDFDSAKKRDSQETLK